MTLNLKGLNDGWLSMTSHD